MNFRRPQRSRPPAVSIVSMADIAFLLIIFFMVTTSFTRNPQIEVQLPSAETGEASTRPEQVTITIRRDGGWLIDERPTDPAALRAALEPRLRAAREPVVTIAADQGVPWEDVVRAMDTARALGITGLELAVHDAGATAPDPDAGRAKPVAGADTARADDGGDAPGPAGLARPADGGGRATETPDEVDDAPAASADPTAAGHATGPAGGTDQTPTPAATGPNSVPERLPTAGAGSGTGDATGPAGVMER